MGIRLYMRNKDYPENELCLGKLYGYVDMLDNVESAKFLEKIGCLSEFQWEKDNYNEKSLANAFMNCCSSGARFEYGELFQMCTEDMIKFIYLYRKDQVSFWENPCYSIDDMEINFIQENATIESIWEFRFF